MANKQVVRSTDQEAESVLKVNLEPEDEEEVPYLVDETEEEEEERRQRAADLETEQGKWRDSKKERGGADASKRNKMLEIERWRQKAFIERADLVTIDGEIKFQDKEVQSLYILAGFNGVDNTRIDSGASYQISIDYGQYIDD